MLKAVLQSAALPHKAGRFPNPPPVTYAVTFDDVTADGPDGFSRIFTHDCTVELYEPQEDSNAEAALEAALDAHGLHWTKQARYWLQAVQRYQVIYEFTYTEKI